MKFKLILCLALGPVLTGCHGIGTQRFTAFAPARAADLENSSRIVLDVACMMPQTMFPDYNLRENLSMLAPRPKHWKMDLTLKVNRVVKGGFDQDTLQIHWLREPTEEQCAVLGISQQPFNGLTNGMSLRIGFDKYSDGKFKNLKIMTLR